MGKVLLIVTGSIAAYKSLDLIRLLQQNHNQVTVVLTQSAKSFVTPMACAAISGNKVYDDLFSLTDEQEMGHINLTRGHDVIVVAPASADILAKMAHGMADDLASTLLLANDKPVIVAPAMNHMMWSHPATTRNVVQLKADGVEFVDPVEGELACGEEGLGKLAPIEVIAQTINMKLAS
tara:strand:+ start:379 stop:915 length:537 start_codon:yes stop_codon:yes gene_type:complete